MNTLEKNKVCTLEIVDIGSEGEGIAKLDKFVIFVPNCLTGDVVEAKILKVKKNLAYAKVLDIITPSPFRQVAPCDVANKCGGCQIQHFQYDEQLIWKQQKVYNALKRIGKIKADVLPTLGMSEPYYYRNKAQYPIRKVNGEIKIGFYAKHSHNVIMHPSCLIQDKQCEQIVKVVEKFLIKYNISIYDEEIHKGLVRHLMVRTSFFTQNVMVCLIINGKTLPHKDEFIKMIRTIDNISSIILNFNTQKTNVILGKEEQVLWGENFIIDKIGDLKFHISSQSFYQVNPTQMKVLYDKAIEFAGLNGSEIVWDMYCGIGTIGLCMAHKAKHIYGVEIVPQAIINAKENSKLNNISNTTFLVGKSEEIITQNLYKNPDIVVVDPPRKGCDEQLIKTLGEILPPTIVYVSCDPATLARDLGKLVEFGYKVEQVQPVDMFPHTVHVETVCLLSKLNVDPKKI